MAKIRSTGSRTIELRFRGALVASGMRGWRVQPKGIFGKPDFAFLEKRIAIFVDSCFWHGCRAHLRMPGSNVEYWTAKFDRNRQRDKKCREVLESQGWTVLRIWEHEMKAMPRVMMRLRNILMHSPTADPKLTGP
jgi:DNA mismatch endonuclease (patch repair protein)